MIQEGREVRYRTNYIMGMDRRLFWDVSFRDPSHNSYHYMVMGCFHSAPLREDAKYLGGRKRLPFRPRTAPTREDGIFAALWRFFPNPQARDARKKLMDIRGHMKTRRQESLCAPRSHKRTVPNSEVGARNRGELERRRETACR